jgi:NAD(P)-dependent dehydrogenase (short-subunit alcohol dehydrogenase family)
MRLKGKVVVITGAGSGIGRASASALAREGAKVVVSDIDDDGMEATVASIVDAGGEATAIHADVSSEPECAALIEKSAKTFGSLDVLYNNAGIALPLGGDGFTPDVDPTVWDRVISTNLSSAFYCAHHAIPHMASGGGGSIINTASSMAHLPLGGLDGYAASKGGVAMLTKSMAPSCGRLGIRVNAISPGYVDTPMNSMIWGSEELKAGFDLGHAMGLQTVEEIADVVVFLASDESRSLTGAILNCDRGWTAFKSPELLRGPRPAD